MQIKFGDWQLRSWREGDEEALVKYGNNRKIWLNLQDIFPSPYVQEDARAWIQRARTQPETYFAIASETEAIGSIGFNLHPDILRRSADIGYWLGEPFWGKGIATNAVKALVQYALANHDLVRLFAIVFEWNPASMRVLEKNGFKLEGRMVKSITKDGKTIDSLLYALIKE